MVHSPDNQSITCGIVEAETIPDIPDEGNKRENEPHVSMESNRDVDDNERSTLVQQIAPISNVRSGSNGVCGSSSDNNSKGSEIGTCSESFRLVI